MSRGMALALYVATFPLDAAYTVRSWMRRTIGLPVRGWF